jgi:hypothetical protein
MTTSAKSAFGTTLTWNGHLIAERVNHGGPAIKVDMLDVTSHDSSSNFKEFVAGLRDGGEFTIEGNFISSDTNGIVAFITDLKAGTPRTVILTGPTAAAFTWTATCLGSAFNMTYPQDGKLGFTATLKITGEPIIAITTSANLTTLTGIEQTGSTALTFYPTFTGAKKAYNVTINTSSTFIQLTPTLAGATIDITTSYDSSKQTVASGAQSGAIPVTDAAVTVVTLDVKETGKVANRYTLYIYTP